MNSSTLFAVVVNDDLTQLNVLSGLVREAGLEPLAFTEAEEALAAMDGEHPPALIVSDLYMPGIDGWRFCRLLRSLEYSAFNKVPVIVVSSTFAGDEPDRIAADLGAEAFIPPPLDVKRFIGQVKAILSGKRVRIPLRALIVEDSKTQSGIIRKTFEAHGYKADTALTARAAADAFRKKHYDIAVVDYHLPDSPGDVLLELFRAERPDCVCLMMTSDSGPGLSLEWMKKGAAAYLRKPFKPGFLIELCTRTRRERALLRVQDLLKVRNRQLQESEERFRTLAECAPVGIFLTDQDGDCTYVNRTWCKTAGLSPEEALGQGWVKGLHPQDRTTIVKKWYESVQSKGDWGFEYRFQNMAGHVTWVYGFAAPASFEDGTLTGYIGINVDITDRKRAEEERGKLQAQLNQAQKMESVGRLAGGIAHDFNNMLGVILGHTELAIMLATPSQPVIDNLAEIRKAAERSTDLIRRLLAFARKQTIAPRVLNINETVEGMLKMLRRLIGEDIDLAWLPGEGLSPVKLDPSQIDQIMANLCVNARDAIAGIGKVIIETGTTSFDEAYCADHPGFEPGKYVRIAVSDDGCGMDKETLSHLFEPFFTTKEMGKGTGLGLATVYGIVKQNNGFINVYSEPGHGTTFKIYLPRHTAKAEQIQKEVPAKPPKLGHETILLVEDEPAMLKMTAMMLECLGYKVLAASTPDEAIRLARDHTLEIQPLMTDVVMPEMNGRDLAKNLKSFYPDIKTLFMSGYTAKVIAHRGVLEKDVNFIQKPFMMQDLAAKSREVLDSKYLNRNESDILTASWSCEQAESKLLPGFVDKEHRHIT